MWPSRIVQFIQSWNPKSSRSFIGSSGVFSIPNYGHPRTHSSEDFWGLYKGGRKVVIIDRCNGQFKQNRVVKVSHAISERCFSWNTKFLTNWNNKGNRKNTGAGEGNRTLVISLEGYCSTIELHPLIPSISKTPIQINWNGGESWIWTNVGIASGFTVRPL